MNKNVRQAAKYVRAWSPTAHSDEATVMAAYIYNLTPEEFRELREVCGAVDQYTVDYGTGITDPGYASLEDATLSENAQEIYDNLTEE